MVATNLIIIGLVVIAAITGLAVMTIQEPTGLQFGGAGRPIASVPGTAFPAPDVGQGDFGSEFEGCLIKYGVA